MAYVSNSRANGTCPLLRVTGRVHGGSPTLLFGKVAVQPKAVLRRIRNDRSPLGLSLCTTYVTSGVHLEIDTMGKESLSVDLRISAKCAAGALLVLALVLTWVGDSPTQPPRGSVSLYLLALLCYATAAITWLLDAWKPLLARWAVPSMAVALVLLAAKWLESPTYLTLSTVPVALTLALVQDNLRTAPCGSMLAATVIAIWSIAGVLTAACWQAKQGRKYLSRYFEQARGSVQEARDRKVELAQALADLTRTTRELALASDRMAALRLIAEDARKNETAFVARVSHEFRTPLNVIIGLVQLLTERPGMSTTGLPPEVEQDLEVILRNCRHLSSMIDDVLDLTRIEGGWLRLYKQRLQIGTIIQEAVVAVRPLTEKRGLWLRVDLPDDMPEVYCDQTRIRQVVFNLVSNAARFTQQGGIDIAARAQHSHVIVTVTDTGPGIASEDIESIFEPFCQGKGDLWRDKGGSGLGLSISQQFVKLHDGRLWVESEPGKGSTFAFALPIAESPGHIAGAARWIPEDWSWRERLINRGNDELPALLHKPRIVLYDETGDLHAELARYSSEVEIIQADGLPAAARASRDHPVTAVLLNGTTDRLPQMVEGMTRQVPGTPVIGCSVLAPMEMALTAGAVACLVKPVPRAKLAEALRRVSHAPQSVLVVDDDPDTSDLFARMLRSCDQGIRVDTTASGEQALAKLARESFDVMLLDLDAATRRLNSWQVLRQMREDPSLSHLPVIVVSAQSPADQPLRSSFIVASIEGGLSPLKLLRCSLKVSQFMLTSDGGLDPTPPRSARVRQASPGKSWHPRQGPEPLL